MDTATTREIVTETPTDAEQPRMYQHGLYILGAVALAGVILIGTLALRDKPVDAGLVAIVASAVGYIGGLFQRRQTT